jgi:hypothetical protein
VGRRAVLPDVAALLLLAWAGLLAYVSVLTLLSDDPLRDGGVSVLGATLAAGHVVAAVGVLRRLFWGRRLGLILGAVGLFGSLAVLVTLAASLTSSDLPEGSEAVLLIPAGMALTYGLIVVLLYRARAEFPGLTG